MKKILFFIAMVAMIAAMASAQIAITASGDSTTSFGIDLDQMDTGFKVSGSAEISIAPEIDMSSAASAVEDGDTVYGQFSISDIELSAKYPGDTTTYVLTDTNGDTSGFDWRNDYLTLKYGSISAKIVLGDLTINLHDAGETTIDYNADIANAYDYSIFSAKYGTGDVANDADAEFHPVVVSDTITGADSHGLELAYSVPDIMNIALDVISGDPWDDATTENEYAFKVLTALTAVENLTLEAAMNFSNFAADQYIAVGGKVGYKIMIGEEDSIEPSAGVVYKTDDDPNNAMGVSGGVKVSIAGIVLTANAGFADTDLSTDGGEQFDITVALDLGLVDGLTAQAALEMQNELVAAGDPDNMMGIHGKVGYAVAAGDLTITPSAIVTYYEPSSVTDDDEELYAKIAVEVTGLIDNTTFTLHWDSNDLMKNDATGDDAMGQVVLDTKVSL